MGAADVVPGVSGGTVALIVGIYPRLITAISSFDSSLLYLMRGRKWKEAATHVDLAFLVALAFGIGSGIALTASLVSSLLSGDETRPFTLATFFGMILASGITVLRAVKPRDGGQMMLCLIAGMVGLGFAAWLTTLNPSVQDEGPSLPYLFACGAIAICAMILPGISGAMILLLLGVYAHLTEIPHNLKGGEHVTESLTLLIVFGCGCAVGLLSFSKLLKWLLKHQYALTMAFLCGLMFGSLPKLWPFQRNLDPSIVEFKKQRFELFWPEMSVGTLSVVAAITCALVFVLTVSYWSERVQRARSNQGSATKQSPSGG